MKIIKSILMRPFIHDTLITTVLITIGKSIGVLIPFFIAIWFGVDTTIDSFFLAYSIVIFLASIFGSTLSIVIVPYITELKKLKEDIGKLVSSILLLSCIIYILLLFTSNFIIRIFLDITTDLTPANLDQIFIIIIEMIPFVIILVWTNTLDGVLNAFKKFKLPAISPAFRAVINIFLIFLLKNHLGIHSIIVGYTCGEFFRFLILLLIIKKKKIIKFSFAIVLNKNLIDFLKKGLYQTIASALVAINPLVDKTMASLKGAGSVSVLYYADRIYIIPVTFLVSGFLVTLLSYLSGNFYLINKAKFKSLVHKACKVVVITSIIIIIPILFFYKPIINFIFSFGKIETNIIIKIQNVFFGYLIGFLPYIISQIYVYALVVLKKTKTLMFWSIITFILNFLLNYMLMQIFDLAGLSLSTSIIRVINCLFFMAIFYIAFNKLE